VVTAATYDGEVVTGVTHDGEDGVSGAKLGNVIFGWRKPDAIVREVAQLPEGDRREVVALAFVPDRCRGCHAIGSDFTRHLAFSGTDAVQRRQAMKNIRLRQAGARG